MPAAADPPARATTPRQDFRVLTRRRNGSGGGMMVDIQLQVAATGALVWSQTFSDVNQAHDFERQVEGDLDALDIDDFRRTYSVPSTV